MKKVISSAAKPAAASTLASKIEAEDALALQLINSQMENLQLRAETLDKYRSDLERRIEKKYSIRAGLDKVDLQTRDIVRGA
jgi:hypothetical protein